MVNADRDKLGRFSRFSKEEELRIRDQMQRDPNYSHIEQHMGPDRVGPMDYPFRLGHTYSRNRYDMLQSPTHTAYELRKLQERKYDITKAAVRAEMRKVGDREQRAYEGQRRMRAYDRDLEIMKREASARRRGPGNMGEPDDEDSSRDWNGVRSTSTADGTASGDAYPGPQSVFSRKMLRIFDGSRAFRDVPRDDEDDVAEKKPRGFQIGNPKKPIGPPATSGFSQNMMDMMAPRNPHIKPSANGPGRPSEGWPRTKAGSNSGDYNFTPAQRFGGSPKPRDKTITGHLHEGGVDVLRRNSRQKTYTAAMSPKTVARRFDHYGFDETTRELALGVGAEKKPLMEQYDKLEEDYKHGRFASAVEFEREKNLLLMRQPSGKGANRFLQAAFQSVHKDNRSNMRVTLLNTKESNSPQDRPGYEKMIVNKSYLETNPEIMRKMF